MSPRIIDSCMGADGAWRVKVRGGALGLTSWATVEEIEQLAADARAEVAKREAEPDPGPNLPCCGYPRAECACGDEAKCWHCGAAHPESKPCRESEAEVAP